MNVQAIDLSETEILRRFSEMEKHFPRCKSKNYFPSLDFYLEYNDNPEKSLKIEADNMFAFVGMGNYVTEVKFENLINAAGNIQLSHDNKAYITIDKETSKSAKKVLATLAHEICHKVLFKNGIYFEKFLVEENEVYADLATFYVGFGHLTMEGYKVENSISGYLTPTTYARAFHIIRCINNNVECNISYLPDHAKAELSKVETESIFSVWLKDFLNIEKRKDIYMMACSNVSHLQFMCDFLIDILKKKSNSYKEKLKELSNVFYGFSDQDFEWHKCSIAFKYMENAAIGNLQNESTKHIADIKKLASAYKNILWNVNYEDIINSENHLFYCPVCQKSINKVLEQKVYHFVCPECKSHILIEASKESIIDDIKYLESKESEIQEANKDMLERKNNLIKRLSDDKEALISRISRYEKIIDSLNEQLERANKKWYKKLFK